MIRKAVEFFENQFSPFARKVRIVLEHKQLEFESIDGLRLENRERLKAVNSRVEVPTLVDDGAVIVGSADIVAYLEHRYPSHPVYPEAPVARAEARAWERCADTTIDAILINVSYWMWAERSDVMPDGLLEAARTDLGGVYDRLEAALGGRDFVIGDKPSIADFGLFPHLTGARSLKVGIDGDKHPTALAWYKRMRQLPVCSSDLARTKVYMMNMMANGGEGVERHKIFWRGDRIEWILARGYHNWFFNEITEGRVIWPGLSVP